MTIVTRRGTSKIASARPSIGSCWPSANRAWQTIRNLRTACTIGALGLVRDFKLFGAVSILNYFGQAAKLYFFAAGPGEDVPAIGTSISPFNFPSNS